MTKNCLIYANCQGWGLGYFLNQSQLFQANYKIEYLSNYLMINEKKNISIDQLQSADLFLYQPLRQKHGIYSTDNVMKYLSDFCQRISFPYLYNDAFWPICGDGKKMMNTAPITELLDGGSSAVDIALKFLSLGIDFQFQKRFENSIKILGEKEAVTTVKALQYILENYKKEKLFLTHNHPSSSLLIHCANQILTILGYPVLKKEEYPHPNQAKLPGYFPMSPYEQSHYQFSYKDDWRHFYGKKGESNWRRVYLFRIMEVCLSRHQDKNPKYYYEKIAIKLFRSLAKYLPN